MRAARFGVCSTILMLALVLPTGCNKKPTAPANGPTITNTVNDFRYQGTKVEAKTGTEIYAWQKTGTIASVTQTSTVSSGFMTLTIYDAGGTQVYQHSLSERGTFPSVAGTAGSWSIRIDYAHATGTVNFRAQ